MLRQSLLTIGLSLFPLQPLASPGGFFAHIWNVGQGQWITLPLESLCVHFDMGGERAPWRAIQSLCSLRTNIVVLTHFDRDHINHIFRFRKIIKQNRLCLLLHPRQIIPSKANRLKNLLKCPHPTQALSWWKWWHPPAPSKDHQNANSLWIALFKHILIPGDAPQQVEKQALHWSALRPVKHLVVGHHGSSSSTSQLFLDALPDLYSASISARKRRYGHPHPKTIQRLEKHGVYWQSTEKKGSLKVRIPLQKIFLK